MIFDIVRNGDYAALCKYKGDVNLRNSKGNTPLTISCRKRLPKTFIEKLCDKGADVNQVSGEGYSPLEIVAMEDYPIPPAGNIYKKRNNDWVNDVIIILLDAGANYRDKSVAYLIFNWNYEGISSILPLVQRKDSFYLNLIYQIMSTGNFEINQYNETGYDDSDIIPKNIYKNQALILAATFGEANLVNFILDTDVNLEYTDAEGYTALMRAVEYENKVIIKSILTAGADACTVDKIGLNGLSLFFP